jgi:hypothetical protein
MVSVGITLMSWLHFHHLHSFSRKHEDAQAQIKDTQKWIQELEDLSAEWRTHCHFMFSTVQQLQNQLQAKEKKKGVHAKKTQVEARVLTSKEG